MPTIARCPRCRELVTIPEGLAAEAAVRCPICRAEYSLSVALGAVPPALIAIAPHTPLVGPMEAAASACAAAETAATHVESASGAEGAAATESAGVQPWEPLQMAPGVDVGPEEVGQLPPDADEEPVDMDEEFIDIEEEPIDADEEPIDAAIFSGSAKGAADFAEQLPKKREGADPHAAPIGARRPWRVRPRRRFRIGAPGSPVRKLLGVIGGGILGLTLGYYLLSWLGGLQFDFMNVFLPGVSHTHQHGPPAKK